MAAEKEGEICPNGALAHLMQVEDVVILCTFCSVSLEEAKTHKGTVVLIGENHSVKEVLYK